MVVRRLLFLLLITLPWSAFADTLTAEVDRTRIGEMESLTLSVKYSTNLLSGSPDFSPLEQQFNVLSKNRKNSFQIINGQSSSWTIWTLMLSPKRIGNLVIPSLEFQGKRTKPIQINVSKTADAIKNKDQEVFFHTETNVKTAYVQGQIIYTEKLYFSKSLDNSQLNEVKVADAVIQSLGEIKHYPTNLNGRRYEVYERNVAIFPQTSGELVIPGPRYTGEISNGPWRPGRPISVSHPPIRLTVLPQPASYPQATWLPAKNLTADYRWSGNPQDLQAGEPATLQLSIRAEGLSSAQLPAIPIQEVDGLKYYPDQAVTNDAMADDGITGSRQQNIAIVPTRAGTFTLPEIKIPWWNTDTQKLEYAVIPVQRISASGSGATQPPAIPAAPQATTQSQPENHQDSANLVSTQHEESTSGMWPWLTLMMTALWLITLYLFIKKPSALAANQALGHRHLSPNGSEGKLGELKKACRENNPTAARTALLSWAVRQNPSLTTLSALAANASEPALKQAINELDYSLYSTLGNTAWQGENLWQLVKNWKIVEKPASNNLMPLYPKAS